LVTTDKVSVPPCLSRLNARSFSIDSRLSGSTFPAARFCVMPLEIFDYVVGFSFIQISGPQAVSCNSALLQHPATRARIGRRGLSLIERALELVRSTHLPARASSNCSRFATDTSGNCWSEPNPWKLERAVPCGWPNAALVRGSRC